MWCSTCQQDVPSLGPTESGGELRCGKCGEVFGAARQPLAPAGENLMTSTSAAATTTVNKAALQTLLSDGPLGEVDWTMEAELRGVQRLVGSLRSRSTLVAEPVAMHASHGVPAGWHATPHQPTTSSPLAHVSRNGTNRAHSRDSTMEPNTAQRQPRAHAAAWTILSLGLAVFVCGAVLLGWSLIGQRDDLWPVGMPLALIGQAGLILGLVLQLDGLWHTSRNTAAALSQLDGELKNVRQATTLLSTSHSGGAQSFYMHLAEGASPQLLLTDLKGQLDLLAQQMARQA